MVIAVSGKDGFRRAALYLMLVFTLTSVMTSFRLAVNVETARAATTIYVSTSGSDITGNGSIATPYKSVTKGMNMSVSGDTVSVAAGTYSVPTTVETFPISLKSGVVLQGAGASTTTIQASGSTSVFLASGVDASARIDGFTITGGANIDYGGGINCSSSALTISNNIILGNTAIKNGGGVFCDNSPAIITKNVISGNYSDDGGGGIYFGGAATATVTKNRITANVARLAGGGIWCWSNSPVINNNIIDNNLSQLNGGGICLNMFSFPVITNNTISANSAAYGGGIFANTSSSPVIANSIIWGNGDDLSGCAATYSDIEDGDAGTGNISANPMFVGAASGNYRLNYKSTCIDAGAMAGAPADDKDGILRPQGPGIDLGAFEEPVAPVYRFYNFLQGVHFYTTSGIEKAYLEGPGGNWTFRFESNAFKGQTMPMPDAIPVYRFYNFIQGVHFYTANQAEATNVNDNLGWLYRYECIAYYAYPESYGVAHELTPVHRFYNYLQGVHFYTANQAEATNVNNNLWHTFRYEGVAYYAP